MAETAPTTFIQWKGTDLCVDFWCPKCAEHSHYDGMFAYHIKCGGCGQVWKLSNEVQVTEAGPGAECVLGPCDAESV